MRFSECHPAVLVVAWIYIDRIFQFEPELKPTRHNVYFLLIARFEKRCISACTFLTSSGGLSIRMAAKSLDGGPGSMDLYSRLSGVSSDILSYIEIRLLFSIRCHLLVLPETYSQAGTNYYSSYFAHSSFSSWNCQSFMRRPRDVHARLAGIAHHRSTADQFLYPKTAAYSQHKQNTLLVQFRLDNELYMTMKTLSMYLCTSWIVAMSFRLLGLLAPSARVALLALRWSLPAIHPIPILGTDRLTKGTPSAGPAWFLGKTTPGSMATMQVLRLGMPLHRLLPHLDRFEYRTSAAAVAPRGTLQLPAVGTRVLLLSRALSVGTETSSAVEPALHLAMTPKSLGWVRARSGSLMSYCLKALWARLSRWFG